MVIRLARGPDHHGCRLWAPLKQPGFLDPAGTFRTVPLTLKIHRMWMLQPFGVPRCRSSHVRQVNERCVGLPSLGAIGETTAGVVRTAQRQGRCKFVLEDRW